jgi:peptidyl-prolyl cis-trans isomerase SurA
LKFLCLVLFLFVSPIFSQENNKEEKFVVIDKILAVFNDQVITLSMVERIQESLNQRKLISPFIFNRTDFKTWEIVQILVDSMLIKSGLNDIGYIINDEQVENSINQRQKQLGVNRKELIVQLNQFKIDFEEYFELIRQSIEFNLFNERIVAPLISITDQEVRNKYLESSYSSKTVVHKYKLVDFTLPKKGLNQKHLSRVKEDLKKFRERGILPEYLKDVEPVELSNVNESSLPTNVQKEIRSTSVENFTNPVKIKDRWHSFFVKEKFVVESDSFQQEKDKIKNQLYEVSITNVRSLWLKREANKHFIKYFK